MIWVVRSLVFVSFAIWFGGFGFYAAVVVPIGTEVQGSAFDQGLITRQVTRWINLACGVSLALMLLEFGLSWNKQRKFSRWTQTILIVVMATGLLALVLIHPQIDQLIDLDTGEIENYSRFYLLHRIYLWVITVQWLAGWIWIPVWMASKRTSDRERRIESN